VDRRGAEEPEKGTPGWRIWDRKRALGIEQDKDLAEKTGLSSGTIGRYRKNERGLSDAAAELLGKELGVTAKWLIYGTDEPTPKQIAERASRGRADGARAPQEPKPVATPARVVERDDAPWKQLASKNPSFKAYARGYLHRLTTEGRAEEAESALDYAAEEGLARDRTEGGLPKRYTLDELAEATDVGSALFRGEPVPDRRGTPFQKAPPSKTLAPMKERAAAAAAKRAR
jgi:transcriptional regulator with XRE-family HTH domain